MVRSLAQCVLVIVCLVSVLRAEDYYLKPVGSGVGGLVFGTDCSVGQVVMRVEEDWGWQEVVFRQRSATGEWGELEEIGVYGSVDVSLFHLDRGEGHRWEALAMTSSGVVHVERGNQTGWKRARNLKVEGASSLQMMAAVADDAGLIHAVFLEDSSQPKLHYYVYDGTASGWYGEVVATFDRFTRMVAFDSPHILRSPRMLSLAVGRDGVPRLVVSANQEEIPVSGGTRVHSDLYYYEKVNGQWHSEILVAGGSYDDAGLGASLAIAPNGTIAVATTYLPRAQTGSPGRASLLYLKREANGSWQRETVANTSDRYASFDGERGTGLYPYLVFDGAGSPHIAFTDHASEHTMGTAFSYSGQLRYASRTSADSGAWTLKTLVSQPTNDAFLRRLDFPVIAASSAACGNRLAFFASSSDLTEFPEPIQKYTEYFQLFGEPVVPAVSWVPEDWVYYVWPYGYVLSDGSWRYFDSDGWKYCVDLANGKWELMNQAEDWVYYMWPYAYSHVRDTWLWHAPDGEQWVVNMDTGAWSKLDE